MLVAVDADDLTEGNNQGIVPVNAGKQPDPCHCVTRPVIPLSSFPTAKTCEMTLKTGGLWPRSDLTQACPSGPVLSWHRA